MRDDGQSVYKAEAEEMAKAQAEVYLQEWAVNQIAANEKYGVYLF